jgi:hypothetical protein
MKTTYPPNTATNQQDWEQHASKNLNNWYGHVHTLRDNPSQLDYAGIERQIFALTKRLETGSVKNYFALKNKIEGLKKKLKQRKQDNAWDNFLAL